MRRRSTWHSRSPRRSCFQPCWLPADASSRNCTKCWRLASWSFGRERLLPVSLGPPFVRTDAMSEPGTEPDGLATARQLGESLAALVGASHELSRRDSGCHSDWRRVARSSTTPQPLHPASSPPLAEPVNEPNVPPTPLQIFKRLLFVGGPPLTAEIAADAIRGLSPVSTSTVSMRSTASIASRAGRMRSCLEAADSFFASTAAIRRSASDFMAALARPA